jgi:hypothetical protein
MIYSNFYEIGNKTVTCSFFFLEEKLPLFDLGLSLGGWDIFHFDFSLGIISLSFGIGNYVKPSEEHIADIRERLEKSELKSEWKKQLSQRLIENEKTGKYGYIDKDCFVKLLLDL